jgi:hypothetical protein
MQKLIQIQIYRLQITKKLSHFGLITFIAVFMSACSMLFISDYDQASMDEMQLINKKIDRFFIRLNYADVKDRKYANYKEAYLDIDVELNALKTMQAVRPMNDLTLKQVDIVLEFWQKERTAHQQKDGMANIFIKLHRSQYRRLFMAMIRGENAKVKTPPAK